MKWFDKWFAKKCQKAWEESRLEKNSDIAIVGSVSKSRSLEGLNGMNFTVYRANGGHIVEYRQYDRKTDRADNKLHIVTDDKELGEEIGKIITFEQLRS